MKRRPLGPALGVVAGCLVLYSLRLPWLVIDPGGGFGRPIYATGRPSLAIAGCAVGLLALALFSLRSARDIRIWQIGLALAVPTLAVLTYAGPLTKALAEQSTTQEYFTLGWGPKVAVVAAMIAILGAVATTSRVRLSAEAQPAVAT
jgi:hypothetical protein